MKALSLLLLAFSFTSNAHALSKIYNYYSYIPSRAKSYLASIDQNAPAQGSPTCSPMYQRMLKDDVLDIRYALGYFDDSTGEQRIFDGMNWGLSPSLDITIYEAMIKTLTSRCTGNLRVCGFDMQGVPENGRLVFHKHMNLHGRPVIVRITMTQASASEYFEQNKGALADRQKALTSQSEENFFGGLKIADIIFYNGHSRNGGGPDFNPPILNSHMKTNYKGYYEVQRPGIKRTMASLAQNSEEPVVGFFSCYARLHFLKTFMNANPNQKVILSSDTIDYFDAFEGSLGYLEGLLRGSCGTELDNTARQTQKVRQGFQSFNFK